MPKQYPSPPHLIPTFLQPKPWTDPMSEQELDAYAQTALLAGAPDTNRGISTLLSRFAGDYVQQLRNGSAG